MTVNETKLCRRALNVYLVCSVVDPKELLALEALYGRNCSNTLIFLKKAIVGKSFLPKIK